MGGLILDVAVDAMDGEVGGVVIPVVALLECIPLCPRSQIGDGIEFSTVEKCIVIDQGYAEGNCEIIEADAVGECIFANRSYTGGKIDFIQE